MSTETSPAVETSTPVEPAFTPMPAPTTAAEAFAILRSCGVSESAALELLVAVAVAIDADFAIADSAVCFSVTEFDDAPRVQAFEAAGRLWANVGLTDEPYDSARRAKLREDILTTIVAGEEPNHYFDQEVNPDYRQPYVAICYGAFGTSPGDCWVQVNRCSDGSYVLSDGDDSHQNDHDTVYLTLEGARAAAATLASELDEGGKLDAEAVTEASYDEARESATPDGVFAFGFVTPEGDFRVQSRYPKSDAPKLLVEEWFEKTAAANPGGNLLWHLMTCAAWAELVDGEWVVADDSDD